MGTSRSKKNNLKHLNQTEKLRAQLRHIAPGTREYATLLLKGLRRTTPRGYEIIVKNEGLTEEKLISTYLKENWLFMIWIKAMMWCEGHSGPLPKVARKTT